MGGKQSKFQGRLKRVIFQRTRLLQTDISVKGILLSPNLAWGKICSSDRWTYTYMYMYQRQKRRTDERTGQDSTGQYMYMNSLGTSGYFTLLSTVSKDIFLTFLLHYLLTELAPPLPVFTVFYPHEDTNGNFPSSKPLLLLVIGCFDTYIGCFEYCLGSDGH